MSSAAARVPYLSPLRCGAFAVVSAAALTLILSLGAAPTGSGLTEGMVAPTTIKAPVPVPPFKSQVLTKERQDLAAAAVLDVLIFDPGVFERQQQRSDALYAHLESVRLAAQRGVQPPPLPSEYNLSSQAVANIVALSPGEWERVQAETTRLLATTRDDRISPDQLPSARAQLRQNVNRTFTTNETAVVTELVYALLAANLVPDRTATDRLRQAAVDAVPTVYLNLARGETIVPDGQYITALSLEKLRAAGLLNPTFGWERLAGDALLALLGTGVLALYLLVAKPEPLRDLRGLLLLGLVVAGTVAAAKFALPGRPVWAVAFPLAASAMLLTGMLHLATALPAIALLALLTTYAADFSQGTPTAVTLTPVDTLSKLALYLTTGSVAALVVWRAQHIAQYFVAGAASAVAGLLVVLAFWLLGPQGDIAELPWLALAALGSGVLSAALALGFFIMLGTVLGLTTRIQLHELAQADHPLLKQLLQEAPGTYYHSLLVGNLAEQACEAIGADALLARVGAYYHDVGKIRNPGFFIENQRRGENIHDRLDPLTSASVVIAHVRDGLGMARQARLPRRLHDFIEEHHGNRLAVAFYNKATHLNAKVNPEMFRYPGPPPRSRETAVVMLADSLEAISRSGGGQTPPELEALVDRVIAERTAEGQLVDCELTLGDVERIRAVFKSALTGIYHPRVQYPTPAGLDLSPVEAARRLAVVGDQQPGDFC